MLNVPELPMPAPTAAPERQPARFRRWLVSPAFVPGVLTLLFLLAAGIMTARHEMWRDEIIAWMLARDAATPWQVFSIIKYEGHPGLWHLLLWPLAHLTWNPAAMQALHVLMAAASVFVLLRFSPFSWPVRVTVALGYFFAYEWTVISRNYAISVLLFFVFCTLYGQRWRRFPLLAAVLFLLCHTNVHSLLLVAVFFVVLLVEFAVAYVGTWHAADRCLGRAIFGFALITAGLVTAAVQLAPPSDSGYAPTWTYEWQPARFQHVAGIFTRAYVPLPAERLAFWNSNRLLEAGAGAAPRPWYAVRLDQAGTVAFGILAAGCLFFLTRPWMAVPYLLGSLTLAAFFYVKYFGSVRHHGFLFLLFVVALWLSTYYQPWHAPRRWLDAGLTFWDRYRVPLLLPLLLVHVWATGRAWGQEWGGTFSHGRAAAAWVRGAFPDRSRIVCAGDRSSIAVTVVGYLKLDRILYLDRNEFGAHLILDKRWDQDVRRFLVNRVQALRASQGKDVLLILSYPLPEADLDRLGARFLKSFDAPSVIGENYYMYLCPLKPQTTAPGPAVGQSWPRFAGDAAG